MQRDDTTDPLASLRHRPEDGREALRKIMDALDGVRPDVAVTALASAAGSLAMMLPPDRRLQFIEAAMKMVQSSWLKAERRNQR